MHHVLIVGGQGTYADGCYHTEFPDRLLALQHITSVGRVATENHFGRVVASGGCTKDETPDVSEAASFERYWKETDTKPAQECHYEKSALDSAENVIFGLMRLRSDLNKEKDRGPIGRIGFYSLWWFKKPRMTGLAKQLGIHDRFYFQGLAHENKANAGDAAIAGERTLLTTLRETEDWLLRAPRFEAKREERYKGTEEYKYRISSYENQFPDTFAALNRLSELKVDGLVGWIGKGTSLYEAHESLQRARCELVAQESEKLRGAFRREVLLRNP